MDGFASEGASIRCAVDSHSCVIDENLGCSACYRTCHTDCSSKLCSFEPCPFCASFHVITPCESNLCLQVQQNVGCHSCGKPECWSWNTLCCHQQGSSEPIASSSSQPSSCTARYHICGASPPGGGCVSCGRSCHTDNTDARCAFFSRARGSLPWAVSPEQMRDTVAGTRGSVPHFSQVMWAFRSVTAPGACTLIVDGVAYLVGCRRLSWRILSGSTTAWTDAVQL